MEIEDKVVVGVVFSCLVINWVVDCVAVGKVLLKVVERWVVGGFLVVWNRRVVPEVVER